MVQCVKLMLRIFVFGLLLFDCFIAICNLSETFYQVWALYIFIHSERAGEVEGTIIGRLAVVS